MFGIQRALPHRSEEDFDRLGRPTEELGERSHCNSLAAVQDHSLVVFARFPEQRVLRPPSDGQSEDALRDIDETGIPHVPTQLRSAKEVDPHHIQRFPYVFHQFGKSLGLRLRVIVRVAFIVELMLSAGVKEAKDDRNVKPCLLRSMAQLLSNKDSWAFTHLNKLC